jgi:hypothetical protein
MKRLVTHALACLLAAFAAGSAAHARIGTLDAPLPAYASPDATSPILGTARAGTRIAAGTAPSGWAAVELAGPHTVFVTQRDTLKNFTVRPGASYLSQPRADAPVIGLAGDNDPVDFADVSGRFNKFSLNKPIIAYVRIPTTPVAPVAAAPAARPSAPAQPAAPAAPAGDLPPLMDDLPGTLPQNIPATRSVPPGQGVQAGEPRLARTFFGVVASSRNPLRPRRPWDFQINDDAGARIAYLDISRLLLTEQIEFFIGRPVTILGTADTVGNDLVIRVESLKLQ